MNSKIYRYSENRCSMNYEVFYPDEYQGLPLLVYLHGAGERGCEISHLYRHGIPKLIKEGKQIAAVVLCPQCPAWGVWDNVVVELKSIIDMVVDEFHIQQDRICITGSSMGGFGTWMMGKTYGNFFSAIAPVAGGGMSWRGANLRKTPAFVVHGDIDTVVPVIYSELMVQSMNEAGGNAELLVLKNFGHNDAIDFAYRNTELIEWILRQRRDDFEPIAEVCAEMF